MDVKARKISEGMKLAAAYGLASLVDETELSPTYVIPNALDPRVSDVVAKAVAKKLLKKDLQDKYILFIGHRGKDFSLCFYFIDRL